MTGLCNSSEKRHGMTHRTIPHAGSTGSCDDGTRSHARERCHGFSIDAGARPSTANVVSSWRVRPSRLGSMSACDIHQRHFRRVAWVYSRNFGRIFPPYRSLAAAKKRLWRSHALYAVEQNWSVGLVAPAGHGAGAGRNAGAWHSAHFRCSSACWQHQFLFFPA